MSDFPTSSATGLTNADQLVDHQVAVSAFLIIPDPNQTVSNLTKQQVHDIFTGKITNWSGVAGSNQAIVLIGRPASSGTRTRFDNIVMAPDAHQPALPPLPRVKGNSPATP